MKRDKFSLSNYKLLTCDMGELVPIGLTEVLPGDSIQHSTSLLLRVSPLLSPVMHPVHARIHHFFVPNRLIWDDFRDFITGGSDGMNASVYPTLNYAHNPGDLGDYLGIPVGIPIPVSALPFRAYALIFNEFFRDQDLVTPVVFSKASGSDTTTSIALQHCAWEKDYFTSARPWTQKGPAITIPLGTLAPVITTGVTPQFISTGGAGNNPLKVDLGIPNMVLRTDTFTGDLRFTSPTGLQADLSAASAASINSLRTAFALQRYEEARARYGSRYSEYLRYLGVRSSDARLQRPEYLGGGSQVLQFSEVLQTGPTTSGSDVGVGRLKGHGIGAMRSNRYRKFFEEHGYVISLLSVKPKTMYTQGLARHWNRRVKEDFFQKELQHIGQQEILNKEIYAAHASPNAVFGYQDRYDDYRRTTSTISGDFRSTLDFWHYARVFGAAPTLNADFVKSVPTKRVNQVTSEDVLWIMANHSIQARRIVSRSSHSSIF